MSLRRAHVFVRGWVQGVNFRYYTRQQAMRQGVAGWVRNLPDGRVEAVFEGEEGPVQALVEWCREGPPAASVERVDVRWEDPVGGLRGFDIRG